MGNADKFLSQITNETLNNLHTSMPCTVKTYYPDEQKADIQPLFKRKFQKNVESYPLIKKVPVLRHVGALLPEETVMVVFAERSLDFVGDRRHDLTDAVIIGVMP